MKWKAIAFTLISLMAIVMLSTNQANAANPIPGINIDFGSSSSAAGASNTINIIILITILSIAPAILVLMTSFTRIIIVLGFVRTALGTQQMPPNQVLIGLALFMTFFIMAPTLGLSLIHI